MMRKPKIKFKENQIWQVFITRTVDSHGRLRIALVVATSDWRRFLELESSIDRDKTIVDFLEAIYQDTPWYHVPLEIFVEEQSLADAIVDSWFLREVEVDLGVDATRKLRAAGMWRKHCQENPNAFRDSTTRLALAK